MGEEGNWRVNVGKLKTEEENGGRRNLKNKRGVN